MGYANSPLNLLLGFILSLVSKQGFCIMSTWSWRLFRGELSDCKQDEGHMEDEFDYGAFTVDDLEEDEVDTSLLSIVRRILAAPKVEKEDWRRNSIF